MNFCSRCALPVNLDNEYTREMELEQENRDLKISIRSVREDMNQLNQQFSQIMSMIQQNPQLAQIKPEVLTKKNVEK